MSLPSPTIDRLRRGTLVFLSITISSATACRAVLGIEERLPSAPEVIASKDGAVDGAQAALDGGSDSGSMCAPNERECGGKCTDVQNNAANCGWCGHACLSSCREGACVASIVKSIDPEVPHNLSSRGTSLQFSQPGGVGRIRRIGKDGMGYATIASGVGSQVHMTLGPARVYWSSADVGELGYAKIPNGTPSILLGGLSSPQGIRVSADGASAYYVLGGASGSLHRIPADGGEDIVLASNLDSPKELTLEDTKIWLSLHGASPGIHTLDIDGSSPTIAYSGSIQAYALDATDLVVSDLTTNALVIQARTSGTQRTLLSNAPTALAMDATYVYFAQGPYIERVLRAGGVPEKVAVATAPVTEIALEDVTELYFIAGTAVCAGTR